MIHLRVHDLWARLRVQVAGVRFVRGFVSVTALLTETRVESGDVSKQKWNLS